MNVILRGHNLLYKCLIFIFAVLYCVRAFGANCPAGFVEHEVPGADVILSGECPTAYVTYAEVAVCKSDVGGICWLVEQLRNLCGAGVTALKTSGGLSFPLYSDKSTSPSICVKYNDTICYVDLVAGNSVGAVNIEYNGEVYHTVGN